MADCNQHLHQINPNGLVSTYALCFDIAKRAGFELDAHLFDDA